MPERLKHTFIGLIGFILSPLSWWNDAFVNIPIAYVIAIPFGMISKSLFVPAMVISYWLTNIVGLLLLHAGVRRMADGKLPPMKWKGAVIASLIYTAAIATLALSGWIRTPWEYFTGTPQQ